MPKLITPERIARNAFGGADILKVQSQHERFLREIQQLPEAEKAQEITNAVKYLMANKSDYWLETAHLLHLLLGDSDNEGLYKTIAPKSTKKDFCKDNIGLNYKTVSDYIRVIKNYEEYGFTEDQIRYLGFTNTKEIFKKSDKSLLSDLSSQKDLNKLKDAVSKQLKPKKQKSISETLINYWNKATEEDKKAFLRYINEGENPNVAKDDS